MEIGTLRGNSWLTALSTYEARSEALAMTKVEFASVPG